MSTIAAVTNIAWVCETYDYDYVNATFKVKAYSYMHALESGQSSRWFERLDGVDVSYTVIA